MSSLPGYLVFTNLRAVLDWRRGLTNKQLNCIVVTKFYAKFLFLPLTNGGTLLAPCPPPNKEQEQKTKYPTKPCGFTALLGVKSIKKKKKKLTL